VQLTEGMIRIPENCAYTSVSHPMGVTHAPVITDSSPRPYRLLNSGMVVLTPSAELFNAIKQYLATSPLVPTFSFPDQDLLANFFERRWKPLPWCYNALKTLREIHKQLWRDEEVRCLHYILTDKPWHVRVRGDEYEEINGWWWERFDNLREEMQNREPQAWSTVVSNVIEYRGFA
jgi:lipopolysaccharide biosynthesis glycosyltransferase